MPLLATLLVCLRFVWVRNFCDPFAVRPRFFVLSAALSVCELWLGLFRSYKEHVTWPLLPLAVGLRAAFVAVVVAAG